MIQIFFIRPLKYKYRAIAAFVEITETHKPQRIATMASSQSALDSATVAPEIFTLRPDYRVLLITIDGITPAPSDSISETLL